MRIRSIDIFRGFTVLLMIFVNDLWTLSNIPGWLEHSKANVDFLGLADIVFPCFLFILGMAIPYAIQNRIQKGESDLEITRHILLRSLALLVMGVFTVNTPELNDGATGMNRSLYVLLVLISFFLVWNNYPKTNDWKKYLFAGLKIAGICMMVWLAWIFRGNTEQHTLGRFEVRWWGILGLIGWTYLTCALIYLYGKKRPFTFIILAWIVFTSVNIIGKSLSMHHEWFVGNGAFHSFSLAGVLAALLLEKYKTSEKPSKIIGLYIVLGVFTLLAGLISRKFFIISKIWATPTWVLICTAIAFGIFSLIYWTADVKRKGDWFNFIKPAGLFTLTCYLIPDVYYCIFELAHLSLPSFLLTGVPGLLKSIAFALLSIWTAYFLSKIKIGLKI